MPLFNELLIAAAILTWLLFWKIHAPEHVQDVFWFGLLGALLGDKAIYVITDFRYFAQDPAHLIFTPQSSLGIWGAAAGGILGLSWILWRARGQWSLEDLDAMALVIGPAVALWSLGFNWIGIPTHVPLFTISTHHIDRFATYFLWFLMMSAASFAAWRIRQTHAGAPGQIAGFFLMAVAIATVLAGLTTAARGHPFTALQWLSLVLAVSGYRLLMPRTAKP